MNSFWKTFFAAVLAFGLVSLVLGFIFFSVIGGIISSVSSSKKESVVESSVLVLELDRPIVERKTDNFLKNIGNMGPNAQSTTPLGLNELTEVLRQAADDARIQGIYIKCQAPQAGMATLQSLRQSLLEFKASKKFIIAYGELMTEKAAYINSVADEVYLYPTGLFEWNGLASMPTFFKGTLDKLGIEPRLFRVGDFKSAAEPFIRKDLSNENRLQISMVVNDQWNELVKAVADSRKLDVKQLNLLADSLKIVLAQDALDAKLIDGLLHEDEVEAAIRKRLNLDADAKVPQTTFAAYVSQLGEKKQANKIAVVYGVGGISTGSGDDESIGSVSIVKALRDAGDDESVKAVVFRVNSGGGSALASDIIAREVTLLQKKKPVIASYGDVSASGGYYITATCEKIVAEPTTVTGSIGVFGMLIDTKKFFNDKLGVTFDRVTTNTYSDLANPNRAMNPYESKVIQDGVNKIYEDFLAVVQKGRNFPSRDSTHAIAGGRIYTGNQAKALGLVDTLGGLNLAIALAAQSANITDYSIVEFPKYKSAVDKLLEGFGAESETQIQAEIQQAIQGSVLPQEWLNLRRWLALLQDPHNTYMLWPFELNVN